MTHALEAALRRAKAAIVPSLLLLLLLPSESEAPAKEASTLARATSGLATSTTEMLDWEAVNRSVA